MRFPTTLHFSSGFPILLGLHHIDHIRRPKIRDDRRPRLVATGHDGVWADMTRLVDQHHHYVIATRPRCMFNSFSWNWETRTGFGTLEFEIGYKQYKSVPFRLLFNGQSPFKLRFDAIGIDPSRRFEVAITDAPNGYPNKLALSQQTGQNRILHLEPDLLHFLEVDDAGQRGCLDFEVQYIGISTGKDGQRNFVSRLWAHEKVRAISAELQKNSPNLQVYVFGYDVAYAVEAVPGRFIVNPNFESQLGPHRFAKVFEAAMISHFKPRFNTEFKNFLEGHRPNWLEPLNALLKPIWEPGDIHMSSVLMCDNALNPAGKWRFGNFFTGKIGPKTAPVVTFSHQLGSR